MGAESGAPAAGGERRRGEGRTERRGATVEEDGVASLCGL